MITPSNPDVRQARIAAGLTQEALARKADVSVATVTRADRGQLPRRSTVRARLLRTLGLLPDSESVRRRSRHTAEQSTNTTGQQQA